MKNIVITYGIPASGKTTYLQKNFSNHYRISVDKLMALSHNDIKNKIIYKLNQKSNNFTIDILVTKNNDLLYLLNDIKESYKDVSFKIIIFSLDREQSILNDKYRNRSTKSELTIKNIDYDIVDSNLYNDFNIEFIYVKTYQLSNIELKALEYDIYLQNNKYFYSSYWSLGGERWSYNRDKYQFPAEEPVDFDEFDELLEKLKPNITFLEYKKLKKECVELEECDSSDYYSNERSAKWKCDLEKLLNLLNL